MIKSLTLVFASAALVVSAVGISQSETDTDQQVVVKDAESLEQIVETELQSKRFASQIAEYNGIAAITTIIPVGTILQIPKPYLLDRDYGQVVYARGDVVHARSSRVVNPPAKGSYIYKDDTFSTGEDGFVSLKFSSGSVVNIQPESQVAVLDIACVDEKISCLIALHAQSGVVESEVTPRPDGEPQIQFRVTTPFLSAAVRGTAFYVDASENADKIGVTRGLVATEVGGDVNDLPKGKGLLAEANVAPVVVDLLEAPELIADAGDLVYSEEDVIRWKSLEDAQRYRLTIARDKALSQPVFTSDVQLNSAFLPQDLSLGEHYVSLAGVDAQEFVGLPSSLRFSYAEIVDQEQLELRIRRTELGVTIAPIDYTGSIEIAIAAGFDPSANERRLTRALSNGLSLELDPAQDWAIKARKVYSDTSVSVYSSQYFLQAQE